MGVDARTRNQRSSVHISSCNHERRGVRRTQQPLTPFVYPDFTQELVSAALSRERIGTSIPRCWQSGVRMYSCATLVQNSLAHPGEEVSLCSIDGRAEEASPWGSTSIMTTNSRGWR